MEERDTITNVGGKTGPVQFGSSGWVSENSRSNYYSARGAKKISGMAPFRGTSQRINLVTEPLLNSQEVGEPSWVTIPAYAECKSGSSRVAVAV